MQYAFLAFSKYEGIRLFLVLIKKDIHFCKVCYTFTATYFKSNHNTMKKILVLAAVFMTLMSCKNETTTKTEEVAVVETPTRVFPESISKVLDAHGGFDHWNTMNNLCFTLPKGAIEEVHTVDLKSRKTRIETKDYTLGFDGDKVWVQQDTTAFNPDRARFYHNLMFYFYAMPFVLSDEGITYTDAPSLEMDGVVYKGTKISFGNGVGDAPDDNYILYSDPTTNEMAWLAYTVTYGSEDGPSERYSYIKYAKWQTTKGVKLPTELQWYNVVDGKPTEMRNAMNFTKPTITTTKLDSNIFEKPENIEYAE